MLDFVVDSWDKNKSRLRAALERGELSDSASYEEFFAFVIKYIFPQNEGHGGFSKYGYFIDSLDPTKIQVIDYGDYQGTLILIVPGDTYQPTAHETFYTVVDYGSCSGCDTLMGIQCLYYQINGLPDNLELKETQINEYMTLALHMIQHLKSFEE